MDESQGVSSGPVSQPPPAAPMPAPMAYPPPRKMDASKPALVIAVIALALALIGMVAFPGPTGAEGPEGPAGAVGADGDDGADGADGADGTPCWDLNGNGVGDPAEDINSDLVVDVNDCTGPEGPQGLQGPQGPAGADGTNGTDGADGADGTNGTHCWDLNGNGIGDLPDEDANGDGVVNVTDCTGPEGPQGPQGLQGPQGDPGPGAVIATDTSSATTTIGTSCTHYDNAEVTITVPSDGTIIVTAQIWIRISHTSGTEDSWRLAVGSAPNDCGSSNYQWAGSITSNAPNDPDADRTGSPHRVFYVSAGTYTYYANGFMVSGQNAGDVFWFAFMIAVFYPS